MVVFNEFQRETAEAPPIPKFEVEFALENSVSLFMNRKAQSARFESEGAHKGMKSTPDDECLHWR
jgi:hypothetical protein